MLSSELFEDILVETKDHSSIPRISAVCTDAGQELFAGGRGHWAHAETRYPIASITKTFTASLIQQALAMHKLSLQTPVRSILPDFRVSHPRSDSLTVQDLLNHQTPMPVHLWAWLFGDIDRRTFVEERLPHLECYSDPDPRYRYSNIMYAVLGLLIEELSGHSWEDDLMARIRSPLDMTQTVPVDAAWESLSHLAPPMKPGAHGPHPMKGFYAKQNHLIAPASELISTAHDLTIWAQHANHTHPWKTSRPVRLRSSRPSTGLHSLYSANGWRMEAYGDHNLYWHSGQCSGYTGILACIPDRNFTLAVLCNLDGAINSLQAMMYLTADQALHLPARDWFSDFPAPSPTPSPSPPPPQPNGIPSGRYHNPGYGTLEIDAQGQVLFQGIAEGYVTDKGMHFPDQEKTFAATFTSSPAPTVSVKFEPAVTAIPFQRTE